MTIKKKEVFISVDVETSGPIPGDYDLLSIGMCLVDKPTVNFYCELKPISNKYDPEALSVTGFNLDTLLSTGLLANVAMAECCKWIDQNITAIVGNGSNGDTIRAWSFQENGMILASLK